MTETLRQAEPRFEFWILGFEFVSNFGFGISDFLQ